jgi:2-methylcitrate dehydratase PrpD
MGIAAGAARLAPVALAVPAVAAATKAAAVEAPAAPLPPYTARLAEFVAGLRYEAIPVDVLQRVKDCIVDTVGVILYGSQFPWSKTVIAYARANGSGGRSRILGSGGAMVHPPSAALAHGALCHAFEQDNLTMPDSGAHPGAALFSPALAIAQDRGLAGRQVLTAFVAGGEVMTRLGLAARRTHEHRGFHAPAVIGPYGGAVAIGHLLGFDAAKMSNAMGVAGSLSSGVLEFARSGRGAMVKRLHMGRAAEGGVLAASLAAEGYEGPPTILEGSAGYLRVFCTEDADPTILNRGLGTEWANRYIMMKRFAAHITAHTAMEAVLDVKAATNFSPSDVAAIEIAGSNRMTTVNNIPAPSDIMIGQYSIPFCVAIAVHRNPVDPNNFSDVTVRDPAILATARQVRITHAPGQIDADISTAVTIRLRDGRSFARRFTDFKGTPQRPLTRAELREKFLLLTQAFPRAEMERWFERIQNFENEPNLDWLSV